MSVQSPEVNEINIKDLVLDEPIKNMDPEADLTEKDWDDLVDFMKREPDSFGGGMFKGVQQRRSAIYAKMIDSQKFESRINIEDHWPVLETELKKEALTESEALEYWMETTMLYPKHATHIKTNRDLLSRYAEHNFYVRSTNDWVSYANSLFNVKLISPDFDVSQQLDSETWETIRVAINEQLLHLYPDNLYALMGAAELKMVDPEKWKNGPMGETISLATTVYKQILENHPQPNHLFAAVAAAKVLAADDVKLTGRGLDIKMPKEEALEVVETFPEQRKF